MNQNSYISTYATRKSKSLELFITLVVLLSTVTFSCKKSAVEDESVLDKNLVKSAKKYQALVSGREDRPGSFEIKNIQRADDILTVTVEGDCNEIDFQVVWNGEILLSYPAQVHLVIYKKSSASCAAGDGTEVEIDLSKIIKDPNGKDFIFHVANGSKIEDKSLNPDGSVSSN